MILRRQLKRPSDDTYWRSSRAVALPDWYRRLRLVAPLVERAPGAWPHRSPDAGRLRQAYVKRHKNDAVDAEAICEAGGDDTRLPRPRRPPPDNTK